MYIFPVFDDITALSHRNISIRSWSSNVSIYSRSMRKAAIQSLGTLYFFFAWIPNWLAKFVSCSLRVPS